MPIYEYHCEACDRTVEIQHGIRASSHRRCKACRKKMQRLISRSSFRLKGHSWAADSYTTEAEKGLRYVGSMDDPNWTDRGAVDVTEQADWGQLDTEVDR